MANEDNYEYTFVLNEQVEVIGHEFGRLDSFYTARIIREEINNTYRVEYNTLNSLIEPGRLTKTVHKAFIRPKPHQTFVHRHSFGSKVDAYFFGGWWTGRVDSYNYNTNCYDIHFNHVDPNMNHHATEVRIYKKWNAHNNSWKHSLIKVFQYPFYTNDEVEVVGYEDGLIGSFHTAKIISQQVNNQYHLEYKTLSASESEGKHTEMVPTTFVRPKPNPTYIYIYPLGARVNVFDNGGWWTGIITRYDRPTRRYDVELDHYHTLESKHISDIRIHQNWNAFDNTWTYSIGRI